MWRSRLPFFLFILCLLGCAPARREIVVWHAYRDDEERALLELANAYERAQGVHVQLLALPHDAYAAKLEASIPHAHGPDLFIDSHERLGSFLKAKLVAPIGDALPDADTAAYDPKSIEAITVDGVRYGVPLALKSLALYWNTKLLAAPPRSIEELAASRARLPEGAWPLAYPAHTVFYHVAFLHAFGGAMLSQDGRFAFDDDAAARSMIYVRDLVKNGTVPEDADGALVKQLFASGHAAAVIDGPWFASNLAGVDYRVAPLPRVEGAPKPLRPYLTVEGAFLTPTGAGNADARAFAKWLGSDEGARVRATVGKQIVATTSAWSDPTIGGDPRLAAFREAAREAILPPTSTAMRATWVPAEEALRKVMRGDDPRAALDAARTRFEDVMKPPPPPPSPAPLAIAAGLGLLVAAFLAVRRARTPEFGRAVRASLPAYKYVAHAALAVLVLVVLPLVAGALTSLFVGTRDDPRYVGLGNYVAILTARGGALFGEHSFWLALIVTVVWTVVNVALHVAIGVALGILLSRPLLKLKAIYRVLLILPWAVPSYVTALAWKGMFHRQFGAINALLEALGATPVSWFSHFSTAFAANVSTNVWLGFPFMMVVTMGALTSIPKDVLEAAEVDGATRWQRFRLVTLPLLRPALLPAVVLGAVWTFNMFNVVFLVSGGEPSGTTDILVSEAYRWAFTRDAQYGYAAAYAVLIFFLLAGGSRLLSRVGGGKEAAA